MIYEINYTLYLFLLFLVVWVVGYPAALLIDYYKGRPFRPLYRLAWPFILLAEIVS